MNYQTEILNGISFEFLTKKYLIFMPHKRRVTPLEVLLNIEKLSHILKEFTIVIRVEMVRQSFLIKKIHQIIIWL